MQWSVYLNNQNEEYKVIEVIILPFPLEFKNSNVMQRSQQLDVSFGNKIGNSPNLSDEVHNLIHVCVT